MDKITGGQRESFEYSEYSIKLGTTKCHLHAVYRPPYSENHRVPISVFFDEFSDYLESIVVSAVPIIISGDFNIHVDVPADPDTVKFLSLLECMGLENHVFIPTHESGHALDLFITRKGCDFSLGVPVADYYISDHSFVTCDISVSKPDLEIRDVTYRKYKSIDIEELKQDLAQSELCTKSFSDLDDLVLCYQDTLSGLMDKHAPEKSKRSVVRPKQPWYNDNLNNLKRLRRSSERKWTKTKSSSDHVIFKKARNKFSNTLETDRCNHLSNLVNECAGDQKKLFKIVSFLTGDSKASPLPEYNDPLALANDFGEFFAHKIETIQQKIDDICDNESIAPLEEMIHVDLSVKFDQFHSLSEDDVRKMISKSASKSCKLDPAPTWIIKQCLDLLLPVITLMINLSLQLGYFPDAWKCAIVLPIIKKLGLDLLFKNFRPVSNLPYISKLTEDAVVGQMTGHTKDNDLLPVHASSHRKYHSTETALLKVQSDIFENMDHQNVTLLVMLDLSAAFDTVSHDVLFAVLEHQFGVSGTVLDWFRSYLTNRKQKILVNDNVMSEPRDLNCGVPQGSCLGPVLFVLYISSLYDVISRHLPSVHGYADDHQLYISFKPDPVCTDNTVKAMEECIHDVRQWMLVNRLMINDSKTEVMLIGTWQQLRKISIDGVNVGYTEIKPVTSVRNLGVIQDNHLKMDQHVTNICKKSFYQLYRLRRIRKYLSPEATQTLVHAFITSNLDYCNSLFYGMPKYLIEKLQRIQNAAARIVNLVPKFDHITPVMIDLHWLPVRYRIKFKIVLLVFKCLKGEAPVYLKEMIARCEPSVTLRSSNPMLLKLPRVKRKTLGTRSFRYAGPELWNDLPLNIQNAQDIDGFKSMVKTHFFKLAYDL